MACLTLPAPPSVESLYALTGSSACSTDSLEMDDECYQSLESLTSCRPESRENIYDRLDRSGATYDRLERS